MAQIPLAARRMRNIEEIFLAALGSEKATLVRVGDVIAIDPGKQTMIRRRQANVNNILGVSSIIT